MSSSVRTVERADGFYVVEYTVTGVATIPLTNPPGPVHYAATIQVFKVVRGKRRLIGHSFPGVYTSSGCFEDDPETLVDYALDKAKK